MPEKTRPTREEIVNMAIKLVNEYVPELQDAELTEDSNINTDASLDSMSMIMVITKLEAAFDVKLPSEAWNRIQTLGELVDAIEENM